MSVINMPFQDVVISLVDESPNMIIRNDNRVIP